MIHGTSQGKFSAFLVDPSAPLTLNAGTPLIDKQLGDYWSQELGPPRGMLLEYVTSGRLNGADITCQAALSSIIGITIALDDFQTVSSDSLFFDVWGDSNTTDDYSLRLPGAGVHIKLPLTVHATLRIKLDATGGGQEFTIDQFRIEWWY